MTFNNDDFSQAFPTTDISPLPPANAGGRDGADRGPLANLIATVAGASSAEIGPALADRVRRTLTGAVWSPDAVRTTTDLARGLAACRPVSLDCAVLDRMAAQMAFAPSSGLKAVTGDPAAAQLVAALAILAFAQSQAGIDRQMRLTRADGWLVIAPVD